MPTQYFSEHFDDLNDWTVNDSNFSIKTDTDVDGNGQSAGIDQTSTTQSLVANHSFNSAQEVTTFEIWMWEDSSSYGSATELRDSNGNIILAFATNNPQWDVYDNGSWTQVDSNGAGYNTWFKVTVTIDWSAGTFDITFQEANNGNSYTGTHTLSSTNFVTDIGLQNYTDGSYNTNNMYSRYDDILVEVAGTDTFTLEFKTKFTFKENIDNSTFNYLKTKLDNSLKNGTIDGGGITQGYILNNGTPIFNREIRTTDEPRNAVADFIVFEGEFGDTEQFNEVEIRDNSGNVVWTTTLDDPKTDNTRRFIIKINFSTI